MRIKNIYLPNWLVFFLLLIIVLVAYFTLGPVNDAVNGFLMKHFGPIIKSINMALSLGVV